MELICTRCHDNGALKNQTPAAFAATRIPDQHQSRPILCTEEGKGSTFSLIIPAGLDVGEQPTLDMHNLVCPRRDAPPDPTVDQKTFSGKVLVAEDVAVNKILVTLLLENMGLDVTIAGDGVEAVEATLTEEFDLILMDMQMPNMNGYEATRALRKKGLTTPVIALTAHAMDGDEQKCLDAGCDGYLSKPAGQQDLLKVAERWLPSNTVESNGFAYR